MEPQVQFLLTEILVACSSITTLLCILGLVFWLERRTPGPVFSRANVRTLSRKPEETPATPASVEPIDELALTA